MRDISYGNKGSGSLSHVRNTDELLVMAVRKGGAVQSYNEALG